MSKPFFSSAASVDAIPGNGLHSPPTPEVERNADRSRFRVKVGDVLYGWFQNTPSNRKAVLVLLREMRDESTGRRLFTEQQLAALLGSKNRQSVDGHMQGFRDADYDMGDYLARKRKVDTDVVKLVWKTLCADPFVSSLSELTTRVNMVYTGDKPLSVRNVREALEQVSGYRVWRKMREWLKKGSAHYDEDFLIERLLKLLSQACDEVPEITGTAQDNDVSEMTGTEAQSSDATDGVSMSKAVYERLEALFCPVEAPELAGRLSHVWGGASGCVMLAFVLYTSGLSYALIGGWLGVDASTVCRWMAPLSLYGLSWLNRQRLCFSGQIAVDEKHITIDGIRWYLFVAVDCVTRCPLHFAFYRSNAEVSCRAFLLELSLKGYRPHVVVTDGWDSYMKAIAAVFPTAAHQLCRFHLIRSVFRRMKQMKFFDADVCKTVKELFQADDPRTVRRRMNALKQTLSKLGRDWIIEGLLSKLEQVMPAVGNPQRWPSTSNAAEWFFRDYERLVYVPKGPFQSKESAEKLTTLFVLGYVLRMGLKGQACPLERAQVDVSRIPLYHLLNRPKMSKLQELIAQQYTDSLSRDHRQKQA